MSQLLNKVTPEMQQVAEDWFSATVLERRSRGDRTPTDWRRAKTRPNRRFEFRWVPLLDSPHGTWVSEFRSPEPARP